MARKVTFVDGKPPYRNCTGCRTCEVICSLVHEETCNPRKGRLSVIRVEPAMNKTVVCYQCRKPPCGEKCPVEAITYDAKKGIVVVDETKCIGCGICIEACPFGAMKMHLTTSKAIKCDLCYGKYPTPACVEFCAPRVLKFIDANTLAYDKASNYVSRSIKSEQKKLGYLIAQNLDFTSVGNQT